MSICKELGEPVSLECILRNDAAMSDSSLDSRSMFASVKFSDRICAYRPKPEIPLQGMWTTDRTKKHQENSENELYPHSASSGHGAPQWKTCRQVDRLKIG